MKVMEMDGKVVEALPNAT